MSAALCGGNSASCDAASQPDLAAVAASQCRHCETAAVPDAGTVWCCFLHFPAAWKHAQSTAAYSVQLPPFIQPLALVAQLFLCICSCIVQPVAALSQCMCLCAISWCLIRAIIIGAFHAPLAFIMPVGSDGHPERAHGQLCLLLVFDCGFDIMGL